MHFGTQTDLIVCRTFKARECGHQHEYSIAIVAALLPIVCIRELSNIGYFTAVILVFSVVAVIIIIIVTIQIINLSPQEVQDQYHIALTDEDRDYKYWDWLMIPLFCSSYMNVFEGNQQVLNIYSQTQKPRYFFLTAATVITIVSFILALIVGYLGYFAFGNATKSLILYNLPSEDPLSVTAQLFYILTIAGAYILLSQPIFHVIESSSWYRFGQDNAM